MSTSSHPGPQSTIFCRALLLAAAQAFNVSARWRPNRRGTPQRSETNAVHRKSSAFTTFVSARFFLGRGQYEHLGRASTGSASSRTAPSPACIPPCGLPNPKDSSPKRHCVLRTRSMVRGLAAPTSPATRQRRNYGFGSGQPSCSNTLRNTRSSSSDLSS